MEDFESVVDFFFFDNEFFVFVRQVYLLGLEFRDRKQRIV